MRVAGIDCGTNSIRLLIADAAPDGGLVDVVREMRVVRLGQGVDRTGRLAPEALARTRVALADYAAEIRERGTERVRMVATSATRDAANRAEFVAMVHAELGAEPEVITGADEAALTFRGAVVGLPNVAGPLLVADIGGGSTELVLGNGGDGLGGDGQGGDGRGGKGGGNAGGDGRGGNAGGESGNRRDRLSGIGALRSHSMDVGCVRMTERHLRDDPPTPQQIAATVADLRAAVDRAAQDVPLDAAATFVGVAGTVTTIAAIALGLDKYDPVAIHGSVISAAQVHDVTDRLLHMTHDQRGALPVMHPGRVDVIGGGALVLRTLIEATGSAAVVASEHDILDGIALSLLG